MNGQKWAVLIMLEMASSVRVTNAKSAEKSKKQ